MFLERKFHLGTGLNPDLRSRFIEFLKFNVDVFAWSHADMTCIPPEVVVHKLSLDPNIHLVRQKKCPIAEVKNKFVEEEVTHLLDIGSIWEVKYPDWGIEVNPDKIKAVEDIPDQLSNVKEVQRLTGRPTALRRFISRSSKKCHHFFSLLKKKNNFEWTPECQQALKDLKRYLSSPLLSSKPEEGEQLLIYLAVSEVAISAILVREDEGRLSKWFIEMSEFDIEYKPRNAIKSHVLADFVADFSPGLLPLATKEAVMVTESTKGVWTLFTDGASNVKGSGLGVVLITTSGETLMQAIRTVPLTNNEAKYEALIAGLELARGLDSEVIEIKCDSQLIVNRVYGIFEAKEERMQQYVMKVHALLARFREWSITHISRKAEADTLANLGSSTEMKGSDSCTVVQLMNSVLDIDDYYEINATNLVRDWRNEIIDYLEHGKLPEDPKASRALYTKAARYCFREFNCLENLIKARWLEA
ncbi:uncharacterized protein [Nicotiana tomentosiformis]|uniref:uncharacterized protein n=1 Tax=Nicotiana tomentosiformis TaxID=4098 RepID=UPI00388C6ED1